MKGNKASIHFQNVQLYVFGILANLCALIYRNEIGPSASTSLFHGFNGWACVVVVANGSSWTGGVLFVAVRGQYCEDVRYRSASRRRRWRRTFASSPIGAANVLGSGVMVISLIYYYGGRSVV